MPYPPSLPPASEGGAVLQPRQLQRWLDINPIHKLTRTQGYFTIPAFSVETEWLGYSDIVAAFNYTASNNFSMKSFTPPTNPNYCACVMWVDDEYNVYRYKLWEDVGEVMFIDIPLYSGQLIKKNFRIEIWSTAVEYTDITVFNSSLFNGLYVQMSSTLYQKDASTRIILVDGVWEMQTDPIGVPSWTALYTTTPEQFFTGWQGVPGTIPPEMPQITVPATYAEAEVLLINSSILGGYDYRFATDFAVATPSTVVTDFSWPLVAGTFPLPFEWPADSVPTLNL